MCIANHPVLYDLHMQALEQSCARLRPETAKPEVAKPQKEAKPQGGGWGFGLPEYAFLTRGAKHLRRGLRSVGLAGQTA